MCGGGSDREAEVCANRMNSATPTVHRVIPKCSAGEMDREDSWAHLCRRISHVLMYHNLSHFAQKLFLMLPAENSIPFFLRLMAESFHVVAIIKGNWEEGKVKILEVS